MQGNSSSNTVTARAASQAPLPPGLTFDGLASAAGFAVCVFTLAGFAGGLTWVFEITSHFRVQYAAILAGLGAWFVGRRRWREVLVFFSLAGVNAWLLLPFISARPAAAATDGRVVRLVAWNVNSGNEQYAELDRLLQEQAPDVLLLLEVSPGWERQLATLSATYPHRLITAREDNFGIALLSREPVTGLRNVYLGDAGFPSVRAELVINGRDVVLLGTHPLPPAGALRTKLRDNQLDRVAGWVLQQTNEVIVAGDLNITPWSPTWQAFQRETGLRNSAEGRGLQATWPAFFPPLGIPIDHFLHSDDVVVRDRRVLSARGSDHLPVRVDFTLNPQPLETPVH